MLSVREWLPPSVFETPGGGVTIAQQNQLLLTARNTEKGRRGYWACCDVYVSGPASWYADGLGNPVIFELLAEVQGTRYLIDRVLANRTPLSPNAGVAPTSTTQYT